MRKHRLSIDRETRTSIVFCRWCAAKRMHPMSSGLGEVLLDKSVDYLNFRQSVFDIGPLLPLPRNLKLSKADEEFNRAVDWRKATAGSGILVD